VIKSLTKTIEMKTKKTILVVEDSLTQAERIKYLLEKNGFTAIVASNGKEAVEILKSIEPVLIISDIIMPVMDGFELCRYLKSDEIAIGNIPFILLTSQTNIADVIHGLEAGADNYLCKPYTEEQLISRVSAILDSAEQIQNSASEKISFDLSLIGEDRKVELRPMRLFSFLASTYETVVETNAELEKIRIELQNINENLEDEVEKRTKKMLLEATMRKQYQDALIESERSYRNIVNNALVGVMVTNIRGDIILANEALVKLLAYVSVEQLMKRNAADLCTDKDKRVSLIRQLQKSGMVVNLEYEFTTRLGETITTLVNGTIDKDTISLLILDITERKKLEKHLVDAKAQAEESDKLKSAFLANLSHEIRTPMNAIIGFSSFLMEQGIEDMERQEYIKYIHTSCENLIEIVTDIVDISVLETEQIFSEFDECNLNMEMNTICELIRKKYQESLKTIELRFIPPVAAIDESLIVDKTNLVKILLNLLKNAVKFTEAGYVEFGYRLVDNDSSIEFYVKDTGIGIPENSEEEIFKKFRQLEEAHTKKYMGTGIGLSIAKKLVEHLGGKIWFTSKINEGSTFYFTSPCKKAGNKNMEQSEMPEKLSGNLDWSKKNILIAEDHESNYFLLKRMLSSTNANLLWARNGKEAVDLVVNNTDLHIILLDIQMPVMDGISAIKKIRQINEDTPIIAQTAYALNFEKSEIIEVGFDDLITKPIRTNDLLEMVEKLIN
jgi:PAS domain S-box-containing protein